MRIAVDLLIECCATEAHLRIVSGGLLGFEFGDIGELEIELRVKLLSTVFQSSLRPLGGADLFFVELEQEGFSLP